jgi:hypothetical protein
MPVILQIGRLFQGITTIPNQWLVLSQRSSRFIKAPAKEKHQKNQRLMTFINFFTVDHRHTAHSVMNPQLEYI